MQHLSMLIITVEIICSETEQKLSKEHIAIYMKCKKKSPYKKRDWGVILDF